MEKYFTFTSTISGVFLPQHAFENDHDSMLQLLFDESFPFFSVNLIYLRFTINSSKDNINSICDYLPKHSSISDLAIEIHSLTSFDALVLAKVFSSNQTLRKVSLVSSKSIDEKSILRFEGLAISRIQHLDLTDFCIDNSNVLVSLLSRSSLSTFVSPVVLPLIRRCLLFCRAIPV
ncbi:hypothetical protein GEMRC1_009564 [Eukaryota sp. GEM-RC1]